MKICAFTNVGGVDPYLNIWLSYYRKYVDHLLVINHGITDDAIEKAHKVYDFVDIEDSRGKIVTNIVDDSSIEYYIREHQRELLKEYDVVIYSHTDEIVIADPAQYKDLRYYVEHLGKDFVFCNGRAVLQIDEEPLDLSKPLLDQRKYWWPDLAYSKPLIAKIPLNWMIGFHTIAEVPDIYTTKLSDPHLYLIHLMQADFDIYTKRSIHRDKNFFHHGANEKEEIPERFKQIV